MKYAVVDTHPEGAFGLLSEPTTIESIGAFATRYEVDRLRALKPGEVYVHQPEHNRGIRRVE